MNTYLKNKTNGTVAAVRASHVYVSMVDAVKRGDWEIVKATPAIRASARVGVEVKTYRILNDGTLGSL